MAHEQQPQLRAITTPYTAASSVGLALLPPFETATSHQEKPTTWSGSLHTEIDNSSLTSRSLAIAITTVTGPRASRMLSKATKRRKRGLCTPIVSVSCPRSHRYTLYQPSLPRGTVRQRIVLVVAYQAVLDPRLAGGLEVGGHAARPAAPTGAAACRAAGPGGVRAHDARALEADGAAGVLAEPVPVREQLAARAAGMTHPDWSEHEASSMGTSSLFFCQMKLTRRFSQAYRGVWPEPAVSDLDVELRWQAVLIGAGSPVSV